MTSFLPFGLAHAEGMDMDQMKAMKKECMDVNNNNNKMCHNQVLKKCEETKSKKECNKMMKKMHKEMSMEKTKEKNNGY